jgi:hypothetical protein
MIINAPAPVSPRSHAIASGGDNLRVHKLAVAGGSACPQLCNHRKCVPQQAVIRRYVRELGPEPAVGGRSVFLDSHSELRKPDRRRLA